MSDSQSNAMTEQGGVVVMRTPERLDSVSAPEFEARLLPQLQRPDVRLVLDLGRLGYISSAGLRVVLMAAKHAKQHGGRFALSSMNEHVHEVFSISGFLPILELFATTDEALSSLKG